MGTWESLKGLFGLGKNVVKAGNAALTVLDKVSNLNESIVNYRIPDLSGEADTVDRIERYYAIDISHALCKMVDEEYRSNRLDLEWLLRYVNKYLEATTRIIETNFFYRKQVLKLDWMPETIEKYMNSEKFIDSEIHLVRNKINDCINQIKNDIKNMNSNTFKTTDALNKMREILNFNQLHIIE